MKLMVLWTLCTVLWYALLANALTWENCIGVMVSGERTKRVNCLIIIIFILRRPYLVPLSQSHPGFSVEPLEARFY